MVLGAWREHFAQAGVTARDIETLAERIDGEALLEQRVRFDPDSFPATSAKRKQTNPFRHF